jgi:metallo-beta-lactamase family protein
VDIEFFGAAGEVTGSCHILRVGDQTVLLDCGLIQGSRKDEERNHNPFPFEARSIDAVVLSHAHLDHCGRLPLLVRRGFRGPIYVQQAAGELMAILLADAAHLEERESRCLPWKMAKL